VSTDCYYTPVSQSKNLERLAVLSTTPYAQEMWSEIHEQVQEQLAGIDCDVRHFLADVQVTSAATRGANFLLFSHRIFSLAGSDIDPVVAGITFTWTEDGINLEADVSGEQTGDMIVCPINRAVANSRHELIGAAHELALKLCHATKAIASALVDTSRRVE
jgi:hypothetical protein